MMSKPISSSAAVQIAHVVLRVLIVVNLLGAVAILALLLVMPNREWIMSSFNLSPSAEAERLIMGLRAIAMLGLVAVPLNHAGMKRLLAIIKTIRAGNPFVAANASRLQAIAWRATCAEPSQHGDRRNRQDRFHSCASARYRRRLFNQRLARRAPHVRAGPCVRGRRPPARRHGRDSLEYNLWVAGFRERLSRART